MELTDRLKGKPGGLFEGFIGRHNKLRLAWYPSAGNDYRPLMLVHHRVNEREPMEPDLYVYTDYQPPLAIEQEKVLYQDKKTSVTVLEREELEPIYLPVMKEFMTLSVNHLHNRVFFLRLLLESAQFGSSEAHLLYVGAMNEVFCREFLLGGSHVSHIIHVRYGSAFGGARTTGSWILNLLKELKTEYFISSMHLQVNAADSCLMDMFPEFRRKALQSKLEIIRATAGKLWSNHGDVMWNLVQWEKQPADWRAKYRYRNVYSWPGMERPIFKHETKK